MKKLTTVCILILIATVTTAFAQPQEGRGAGAAYAAGGAVGDSDDNEGFWQFGGGGEYVFSNGLGFEVDVGIVTAGGFDASAGVFSVGPLYEFKSDKKTAPFLTGGYTLFFRSGTANAFHVGGGVRHWFNDSFGMRFEVRDEVVVPGSIHFIQGRVTFLFR